MKTFNNNENEIDHDQNSAHLIKKGRYSYLLKSFKETSASRIDIIDESHVFTRRHNNNNNNTNNNNEAIKILFLITTSFLVLNLPLALIKTYQFFNKNQMSLILTDLNNATNYYNNSNSLNYQYVFNDSNIEELMLSENNFNDGFELEEILKYSIKLQKQEVLWKISFLLYYVNFSINFFLYLFKKRYFNESLVDLFRNFRVR
jgi:hypothetical protein